jgi:hypothetical protein
MKFGMVARWGEKIVAFYENWRSNSHALRRGVNGPSPVISASVNRRRYKTGRRKSPWSLQHYKFRASSLAGVNEISHTPRRSHAAPMPFPCHAVPLRV